MNSTNDDPTERAIFEVLPKAKSRLTFVVEQDKLILADDQTIGELIYAGYDQQNKLVGIAINAAAQGYQDTVKILYGYNPESGCITGFDVLKSTETPGFGTKITTDEGFLANFKCLDAQVNVAQSGLANAIKTLSYGVKKNHEKLMKMCFERLNDPNISDNILVGELNYIIAVLKG